MRRLIVDPRVETDIAGIRYYIQTENPLAAKRLIAAIHKTVGDLLAMPNMGRSRHFESVSVRDIRSWRISGFERYHIFYRPLRDGIHVLRIYHDARDIEALFANR